MATQTAQEGPMLVPRVEVSERATDPEAVFAPKLPGPKFSSRKGGLKNVRSQYSDDFGSDTDTGVPSSHIQRKPPYAAGKQKRHHKFDDWTDNNEPEERRRIQNRIAQREKAREVRERAQRDAQNQELAGSSYEIHVPESSSELSGLPWGSINLGFMVAKGHEYASKQPARKDMPPNQDQKILSSYGTFDTTTYCNGDDVYYQDQDSYGYNYDFDSPDWGYSPMGNHSTPLTTFSKPEGRYSTAKLYSVAPTFSSGGVQNSVPNICEAVYMKLREDVGISNQDILTKSLPNLIKGFAVKLGADHQEIIEITAWLTKFFEEGAKDAEKPRKASKRGMDLSEKIHMWHSKAGMEPPGEPPSINPRASDGSELGNDEEKKPITKLELSEYSKRILESKAYGWLSLTLATEASLFWPADTSNVMVDEKMKATFNLPPLLLRPGHPDALWNLDRARTRGHTTPTAVGDIKAVTYSSEENIQVATIAQYCRQTWPTGGPELIQAFQRVFESPIKQPLSATLGNDICVELTHDCKTFTIAASGSAYSIAQLAEQLAWLTIVLGYPASPPETSYQPSIKKNDEESFEVGITSQPISLDKVFGSCLLPAVAPGHPIVYGYPTARRPEGFPGVEIPYQQLLALTTKEYPGSRALRHGSIKLSENRILQPVLRKQGFCLWHVLDLGPTASCPCFASIPAVHIKQLSLDRHIVGVCSAEQIRSSEDVSKLIPTIEVENLVDETDCRSPDKSCGATPATDTSRTESLDPDVLSVSSFCTIRGTQSPQIIALLPTIESVSGRLFIEFQGSQDNKSAAGGSNRPRENRSGPATARSTTTGAPVLLQRKRGQCGQKDDDQDDDGFKRPSLKKPKGREETRHKMLACPFWKSDPTKHRACFTMKLHGIPRVKQHLTRNHTPIFCQRCLTIFEDDDGLERHLESQETAGCTRKSLAQLDGVSPRQQRELSRKSDPSQTEPEKWFAIWDIVLPGRPRPSSPYMDDQLSEDCAAFHNYCLDRGPEFLTREIETSGVMTLASLDEDTRRDILQETIGRGLDLFLQSWVPPRRANAAAPSGGSSFASQETPGSSETSGATPADDAGSWSRSQDPGTTSSTSSHRQGSEQPVGGYTQPWMRPPGGASDIAREELENERGYDQVLASGPTTGLVPGLVPGLVAVQPRYTQAQAPRSGLLMGPPQSQDYSVDNFGWQPLPNGMDEWFQLPD
ncbi:hypothetical protein GQ53DRAFT_805713 [Thozetella sp. PMI_491]|nr:hypothetical protein GQ53DRAFT_805713 [Thozetella sp. PMI_491]